MNHPTLSVLMPNYNHSRYLHEAITAIVTQSFRPTELIVIDDCSTDNSVSIIQSLADKHEVIRFIRNEKNMGAVSSIKKLLQMATGDYVYFAAADDMVLPGFFEKSMELLQQYPDAGFCACQTWVIDKHGTRTGLFPNQVKTGMKFISPEYFAGTLTPRTPRLHDEWFTGNTAIYRKKALIDEGGFDEAMGTYIDGFILHILALRHGACYVSEPLTCWRSLDTGLSQITLIDPGARLGIVNYAHGLMLTKYAGVFPSKYAAEWERRQRWNIDRMLWRESFLKQTRALREKHNTPNLRIRAAGSVLQLATIIRGGLSFFFLASRFGGTARRWMWNEISSLLRRHN